MLHQRQLKTTDAMKNASDAYEKASDIENDARISSSKIAEWDVIIKHGDIKNVSRAAAEMVMIVNRAQESMNVMNTPVYTNHIANAKKEAFAVKALVEATSALAAAESGWVHAKEYLSITEQILLKENIAFAKEGEVSSAENANVGSVELLREIAMDNVVDASAKVEENQRKIMMAAHAVSNAAKVIVSSVWKKARVQKLKAREVKDRAMENAAANNSILTNQFRQGTIHLGNTEYANTNTNVEGGRRKSTRRKRTHRKRTHRKRK